MEAEASSSDDLSHFQDLTEIDLVILERKYNCLHNFTNGAPTNESALKPQLERGLTCPRTFDGWSCWNETVAGGVAYEPCPYFITGFDPKRFGHKECMPDGSWFRHPESNVTWSNYTSCVDIQDLARRQTVITIHEVGYLISVCALIISLVIFCSFRCLECTRVRIHKHLFVSFIINNVLWLIWYRAVVTQPDVLGSPYSWIWCAPLHLLLQYFLVANYFWMFCEGFYLHTLIVFTFTRAESKLLLAFIIFGWLGPVVPIGLYAGFRANDEFESQKCWISEENWYRYFLSVPVCLSLLLSLVFLINILRILLLKLSETRRTATSVGNLRRESGPGGDSLNAVRKIIRNVKLAISASDSKVPQNSHSDFLKAAKATLILIPLLGLHYLLTPFRPERGSEGEIIYEYITAVSMSLQGLCVSLLFCFCNGEVMNVLRRRFCSHYCPGKSYRGDYSCAPTSMSVNVNKISRLNNTVQTEHSLMI